MSDVAVEQRFCVAATFVDARADLGLQRLQLRRVADLDDGIGENDGQKREYNEHAEKVAGGELHVHCWLVKATLLLFLHVFTRMAGKSTHTHRGG